MKAHKLQVTNQRRGSARRRAVSYLILLALFMNSTSCTTLAPDRITPMISVQGDEIATAIELTYNGERRCYTGKDGRAYELTAKKNWLGRNWKWLVALTAGVGIGMAVADSGGDDGGKATAEQTATVTRSSTSSSESSDDTPIIVSAPEPAGSTGGGSTGGGSTGGGGGDETPW